MGCKQKLILLVAFGVIFSGCAGWRKPFDDKEWALAGIDTFFHIADYSTTKQLKDIGYEEYNPIIENANHGELAVYYISTYVLKMAIAKSLPHKYRKWWLGLGALNGAAYTINNLHLEGVNLWGGLE